MVNRKLTATSHSVESRCGGSAVGYAPGFAGQGVSLSIVGVYSDGRMPGAVCAGWDHAVALDGERIRQMNER